MLSKKLIDFLFLLSRFLDIFGKVFHFVTKDIESKLNLLDGYMKDESLDKNYQTLQSMVEYERKNNLLKKDDRPSGKKSFCFSPN